MSARWCHAMAKCWARAFLRPGLLIGVQKGPLCGVGSGFVPVANRRAPRASRSALTSDGAARAGGACLPTGAKPGWHSAAVF